MNKSLILTLSLAAATVAGSLQAQTANQRQLFRDPIVANVVLNNQPTQQTNGFSSKYAAPQTKQVYLMNVPLTAEQKAKLQTFAAPASNAPAQNTASGTPAQIELGMNNVPVLDQGRHGTCATFANTAAVDAILYKKAHISELCLLDIGTYLQSRSYLPDGWEGSWGPVVLDRMMEFGVVGTSAENQAKLSCAIPSKYPLRDANSTDTALSIDDYSQASESLNYDMGWYSLITPIESFNTPNRAERAEKLLNNVKTILASDKAKEKRRLTFGVLLNVNHCSVGACAKRNKTFDTWALTNIIRNDQHPNFGGHEMVITGYDDNATATDDEGKVHTGLLTLRNSWSTDAGDNGNYYMTYEYFKQYTDEVQVVEKY